MRGRPLPSAVWLVPLAAALVCLALLVSPIMQRGPEVNVSFVTAEGLEVGKTRVRYKDVEIGKLTKLRLSDDRSRVLATLQLNAAARRFATCSTGFWVVRPRIDTSGISGLATVVSGPYIAVDLGRSATRCKDFTGLETPPLLTSGQNGRRFILHAESLGSLNVGAPVYFRRVQAGQVLGYSLAKDGGLVDIDVFVKAPYDRYITADTQWWHASGIDLRLDSSGLRLNTQSMTTLLSGGVVFDLPESQQPASTQAPEGTAFDLARDQEEAIHRANDGPAAPVTLRFTQSIRGLSVGAPVDFHGVELGQVSAIDVDFNRSRASFDMVVTVSLYPYRLGRRYREAIGKGDSEAGRTLLRQMVAQGLRGQLRMGSVLTGQRYVALDFFPHVAAASIDTHRSPVELPTVPSTLDALQDQLASIVSKLDRVPFDELGSNLNKALVNANTLFQQVNTELVPQARTTLAAATQSFNAANATLQQDSPMQSDVHEALTELRRTLVSLHALSDYLERHPESIVWGKSNEH
jgi:paraquat-inducible protein B